MCNCVPLVGQLPTNYRHFMLRHKIRSCITNLSCVPSILYFRRKGKKDFSQSCPRGGILQIYLKLAPLVCILSAYKHACVCLYADKMFVYTIVYVCACLYTIQYSIQCVCNVHVCILYIQCVCMHHLHPVDSCCLRQCSTSLPTRRKCSTTKLPPTKEVLDQPPTRLHFSSGVFTNITIH